MAGNKRENAELKSQVDCEQHQCENTLQYIGGAGTMPMVNILH
eukprot:CAMPEP_0172733280 /NCGR_PEP_ID=MMETSP1074-20121228/106716_1 /TAXON_ID=2916 /ORGANISM="Ceratium fusus, Strain PA161109" /LENGTH=42 /DNA_ID= /DNA_START= /DNA_END= /DNA_ORIENTATION=